MNLWDIQADDWDQTLLALVAEENGSGVSSLREKLGDVERTPGKNLGKISSWFVDRFGFSSGRIFFFPPSGDFALISM